MAKPHYRSGGRERTGTEHSRVAQSYAREQELARQRTGRADYEGYGRPYDYDAGNRYTRDTQSPSEPLFGDRLYGDRQARQERGQNRGRGPRGYQRSDDRIREEVCERLTDDEYIDASDVEVTVSNCEVALSGRVRTREQKRRAIDIAEDVSGVHHVRSGLKIG